jgi:replicative DNA helicase
MAADFEAALISTIIDTKDFRTVIRQKIDKTFFFNTYHTACFEWLTAWYSNPEYGDTPSWENFLDAFPEFTYLSLDDSITALCDKVREAKLYSDIATVLQEVGERTQGNPKEGFERLKTAAVELAAKHNADNTVDVRNQIPDVIAEYMRVKESGTELIGKAYPWPALNNATQGLRDGQIVLVYGLPKTKKTWLLLAIAAHNHETGGRPLILSQEMPEKDMVARYVAMSTGLDYDRFRRGKLTQEEELEFFGNCEAFQERPPVHITTVTSTGKQCVPDIQALVDEYRPTLLLIDSVQLLVPTLEWRDIAMLMTGLRSLVSSRKIPCVASTHRNRSQQTKKATLQDDATDFAYASGFHQMCDLALRVTADIDNKRNQEVCVYTSAVREGKSALFTVNTKLAYNLTQKSVLPVDEDADMSGYDTEEDQRGE